MVARYISRVYANSKRTLQVIDIILVDPASSYMLVSKIKPCMSKYKLYLIVKPQKAQYNSYYLFDYKNSYLDNCGNSRANTCKQHVTRGLLRETCAFIRLKPYRLSG